MTDRCVPHCVTSEELRDNLVLEGESEPSSAKCVNSMMISFTAHPRKEINVLHRVEVLEGALMRTACGTLDQ